MTSDELILIISALISKYKKILYVFHDDGEFRYDVDYTNIALICIRWVVRINVLKSITTVHNCPLTIIPGSSVSDYHNFIDDVFNVVTIYINTCNNIDFKFVE